MANKLKNFSENMGSAAENRGDIRSDMALELVGRGDEIQSLSKIKRTKITIDKEMSERIRRPMGEYITLETTMVKVGLSSKYDTLSRAISRAIKELSGAASNILVVGLGNPSLTADALGNRVFKSLNVTRHLPKVLKKVSLSAICPNVMGATGIESFDVIKGVCSAVKPDLIIAVDSLASAAVGRIGSAFQVCSGGITPGSGVGNHRLTLSRETLGIDVISVGVPLVVFATTIINESGGDISKSSDEIRNLIVTPKDIDVLVNDCGEVIAKAINMTYVE